MAHYGSNIHQLGMLLRGLEACAALLLLSWFSARLPTAAAASGNFLHSILAAVVGRSFFFLLCNAIILVLFANYSRHDSSSSPSYDTYMDSSCMMQCHSPPPPAAAVVTEDRSICLSVRKWRRSRRLRVQRIARRRGVEEKCDVDKALVAMEEEEGGREEDDQEFRRTVEAFIENQLRFRMEESMA